MLDKDKRKNVGHIVYSKAIHVTTMGECSRLFVKRVKVKELPGKVVKIRKAPISNNRSSTYIVADYVFSNGRKKRKELLLRSVSLKPTTRSDKVSKSYMAEKSTLKPIIATAPASDADDTTVVASVVTEEDPERNKDDMDEVVTIL